MAFPCPPPSFSGTEDSILREAQQLIDRARGVQDSIVATVTPETATLANTLLPIVHEQNVRLYGKQMLEFHQHVSTDDEVRDASRKAERLFTDLETELAMREDMYDLVRAVALGDEKLDEECRRLLEQTSLKFKRNGLHCSERDRDRLRQIKQNLSELKTSFEKNLDETYGCIWLARDELQGLPDETFANLETDEEDKVQLTFQWPHVMSALSHVKNGETRRKIYVGNAQKCEENVQLLDKALVLRDEAARLLGYANHAEFRLEDKMQKSPQKVNAFLADVRARLMPKREMELQRLAELKAEDLNRRGVEDDGRFYLWDQAYYSRVLVQRDFAVDHEKVAEYFSLEQTVERMLVVFAELFGMSFEAIPTDANNELVWHEDVRMFSAWHLDQDGGEKAFLGYLYMDLHPRPGKLSQICDLPIRPGFLSSDGERVHPATALICNFPKSSTGKPTLLKHFDVWQLFHELGHGIHDLVSKTRFACFHGPETAQDFTEAPSQMLEKFCWMPEVLKRMGSHYASLDEEYAAVWRKEHPDEGLPSEKMPDDLIERLIRSRKANQASFWLQSLFRAVFDMTVHQPASHGEAQNMDTTKLWNDLLTDITGLDGPQGDDWGQGQASFAHLFRGYDAGFYSYLTSQVYASDMFYSVFAKDPLNREQGLRWIREILEKGGSSDEMEGMRRFLGREPTTDAFFEELGTQE